jgi:XTP/dITP diphosphohydrolase
MDLILASGNAHKIREIASMLPDRFQLKSMGEVKIVEDIPETGATIHENAELKAAYVYALLKGKGIEVAVLADDSGLEVAALNGAPGVYSARYAGESKNDVANNAKLLLELKNVTKREARFVTVLSLIINGKRYTFEGEVKGTIAYEARGTHGFGYDPLFIPRAYRSTFAELGDEVKNSISHRAEALKKLLVFLSQSTNR